MQRSYLGAATALCVVLAACGGADQPTASAPGAQSAVLGPLGTVSQPLPSSTSGTVYERLDSVAYPPDFAPPAGIADVSITLASNVTRTNASGQFTIPSSTTPTTSAVPLGASVFGYANTVYPWVPGDASQSIRLGAYPGVAAQARPGFIGGPVVHDVGGFLPQIYGAGLFAPTYDHIRNVMGGNVVAFSDTAWVTAWNPNVPSVTIKPQPDHCCIPPPSLAFYQDIVGAAKARNLQFMMILGIFGDGSVAPEIWRWQQVPASNTAYWDGVFASYTAFVLERTAIARDTGIEHVSLSLDLNQMWAMGPSRWQPIIQAMRGIGYTGKITWFMAGDLQWNYNPYAVTNFGDGTTDRAAMMGLFDEIGVIFSTGALRTDMSEQLALAQPRSRLRSGVKAILDTLTVSPVPVLAMVTTPSVHGGAVIPEYIEPCLQCGSLAGQRTRDYQQQADMYQAVAEAINDTPTGNGRVMGLLSWGYHYRDDPTFTVWKGDSAYDKSGNIRGKPAEAVMAHWLQRWKPSDRNRVFNWAEATFPQYFAGTPTTGYYAPYTYRFYPQTGNYLAEADGRMVVHNGHDWILQDVGAVADFLATVTAAGF